MSKPSYVIAVVEDNHHRMLVYRYLRKRGILGHQIRIERSPSGRGSAENWVRSQFVIETNVYRARHGQTALIVMIDADTGTVQNRWTQLDQALRAKRKQPVGDAEHIARLVPKRNVETWILCLNGQAVDEETDYKNRNGWSDLIAEAAETLFQWTRSGAEPPEYCIDSLRRGIRELGRLRF
jgi:hypothetical protein